jgi:hypothetical protein
MEEVGSVLAYFKQAEIPLIESKGFGIGQV